MDPNQSVYDSDTDDEMMMVKKKECTFFGYFCPKIGDGLKYTQSEKMAPWIELDVYNKIHVEINIDRYKCQIRNLTLGMVEGKSRSLYFEDKLFSNPIITFMERKNHDVLLYIFTPKKNYVLLHPG